MAQNTRVLYRVENRQIYLELEENTYFSLDQTFIDFCKSDTCLAQRLEEYMPIYNSRNPLCDNRVTELIRNKPIIDKQEVIVEWSSLKLKKNMESTVMEGQQVPRIAQNAADSLPSYSVEVDFKEVQKFFTNEQWSNMSYEEKKNEKTRFDKHKLLLSMSWTKVPDFVPVPPTPFISKPPNGKKKTGGNKKAKEVSIPTRKSNRKRNPTIVQEEEEEEDDDSIFYETATPSTMSTNVSTNENEEIIESFILEDEEEDLLVHFMENENNVESITSTDELNSDEDQLIDANQIVCFSSQSNVPETNNLLQDTNTSRPECEDQNKENVKPKRQPHKRQKLMREFGKQITIHNALPTNYSEQLDKDLKNNKYNVNTFLTFTREYIRDIIGNRHYPFRHEYKLLCGALIKKYPSLADADNPQGFRELKYQIRKSLSGALYRQRKAEELGSDDSNRVATHDTHSNSGVGGSRASTSQVIDLAGASTSSETITEMDLYIAELKTGEADTAREAFLVRKTLTKRQESVTPNMDLKLVEAYIKEYPHYMKTEMLLYEYSLSLKESSGNTVSTLSDLQNNAQRMLQLLEIHFKTVNQIDVVQSLQAKLVPEKYLKRDKLMMLFTIKHIQEVQGSLEVFDTTQEYHSPCVLVLVDNKESGKLKITKSLLKMNKGTISMMGPTTMKTVILQALAPYFIFGLKYPPAYESILRFIEKSLHGFFCEESENTRPKIEYKKFIKELMPQDK